jgi:hypothetical protein
MSFAAPPPKGASPIAACSFPSGFLDSDGEERTRGKTAKSGGGDAPVSARGWNLGLGLEEIGAAACIGRANGDFAMEDGGRRAEEGAGETGCFGRWYCMRRRGSGAAAGCRRGSEPSGRRWARNRGAHAAMSTVARVPPRRVRVLPILVCDGC